MDARECGDSVAFFRKDYGSDFIDGLKKDLEKYVKISKTDRVYVIYMEGDTDKTKGKFLFGARKRSAWEGYAIVGTSAEAHF